MTAASFIDTPQGRRIAYHRTAGYGPGVVFLGGFMSDMEGTKALHLEAWAKARGRAFLRFDYSGHGQSSGAFTDGCIGDWYEDALAAITAATEGPQILVGSSMGGWIALLIAKRRPELVAGLIGIAAAPDFTADAMWDGLTPEMRAELASTGQVAMPSDYSDEPYMLTQRLFDDGANQLVLRDDLRLPMPCRFLQGTADEDVSTEVALRLLDHAQGDDIRLTLVKGADHRFSEPPLLRLIEKTVHSVTKALEKRGESN